jgi:predicted amidohydrolase
MTSFKTACVQMRSGREVDENVRVAQELIREAHAAGAEFILTPENTTMMELERERVAAVTFPDDGDNPTLRVFQELAEELGIWLLIGSLAVKVDGPAPFANRSVLIKPDGRVAARYDKIHMFDVVISDAEQYKESKNYQPGGQGVITSLPWGDLGMTICYDLRFPYLYRALAQAGASYLSVPAAFTRVTGQAHWHVLLRARAIETGCFVFAAAQGGMHENGRATFGHSMIVNPWGEILAEAGEDPSIVMAKIDPEEVKKARARIPALDHGVELPPVVRV